MSSGVYVTIELEKFKQDVLRGIYDCNDIVFSFPKCQKTDYFKLKYLLYELLQKTPVNEKMNFENPFHIAIPSINLNFDDELKHMRKDPFAYCYLSNNARIVLDTKIENMVQYYVRNYFQTYDLQTRNNKMSIRMTMNKLNLDESHYDKMIKEYSRYKSWVGMLRKRKNITPQFVELY